MISTDFLDSQVFDWVDQNGPGCSVGIYLEGESIFSKGYGMANLEHGVVNKPGTVFHVASISKQFTAMAIGLLACEGRLDIDTKLKDFFPDLQVGKQATLRQIIHHTSGLRDQWGLLDLAGWRHEDIKTTSDIVQLARRQRTSNFQPGSRFQYINTGYTLLGEIVQRITGQSLREFAQARIFEPLGMKQTRFLDNYGEILADRAHAYNQDDEGILRGNIPAYETVGPTGLYSSVADFLQWERNFLDPKIGNTALINEMCESGVLADGTLTGYGFGLAISEYKGLPIVEHAGGDAAFRSHFLRFPKERFAVAIFCNTPDRTPGQIAKSIAEHVLADRFADHSSSFSGGAAARSRATGVRAPSTETLLPYCGRYKEVVGNDTVELVYREGIFLLVSQDETEYELSPTGPKSFAFSGMDASCHIEIREGLPLRLRTFYGSTETALLEAVEEIDNTDFTYVASDYIGDYNSDELNICYNVEWDGDSLFLDRGKKGVAELKLVSDDCFICKGGLVVQFERDLHSVRRMLVSAERVWNVSFKRR